MTRRRALGLLVLAACVAIGLVLLLRRKAHKTHAEVTVVVTGAHDTPANVERTIGEPLERAARGIPGVVHMELRSNAEGARLSLILGDDADKETAAAGLTLALGNVAATLPADARPTIPRGSVSNVVHYVVTGDTLDRIALRKLQDGTVAPALAGLPGVSSVEGCGGSDERIEINLDAARLAAFGIDPVSLVGTLRAGLPVSKLEEIDNLPLGTQKHVSDVAIVARAPVPPPCLAFGPLGPLTVGAVSFDGGDTKRIAGALAAVLVPPGVKLVPFDFSKAPS